MEPSQPRTYTFIIVLEQLGEFIIRAEDSEEAAWQGLKLAHSMNDILRDVRR